MLSHRERNDFYDKQMITNNSWPIDKHCVRHTGVRQLAHLHVSHHLSAYDPEYDTSITLSVTLGQDAMWKEENDHQYCMIEINDYVNILPWKSNAETTRFFFQQLQIYISWTFPELGDFDEMIYRGKRWLRLFWFYLAVFFKSRTAFKHVTLKTLLLKLFQIDTVTFNVML